uniref:Transmembrane protein n=1 Tax=Trichuris muris TaxID=70415 RepID=A0A5S6QXY4_TRIMR
MGAEGRMEEESAAPRETASKKDAKPPWETVIGHTGMCGDYCPFCYALEGVDSDGRLEADTVKRNVSSEQSSSTEEDTLSADKEAQWACVICQVYSLFAFHLAITTAVTSVLYWLPTSQTWIFATENHWLLFSAASLLYSIIVAASFSQFLRLQAKTTTALLVPLALGEGYVTAFAMSIFQPVTVLISTCLLIGIYLLFTLYSFQSKVDVTKKIVYLSVATIMIIFSGILATFMRVFTDNYIAYVGFSTICIILTLTWIITDTQLLQGDKACNIAEKDAPFMSIQLSTENLRSPAKTEDLGTIRWMVLDHA